MKCFGFSLEELCNYNYIYVYVVVPTDLKKRGGLINRLNAVSAVLNAWTRWAVALGQRA